MPLIDVWSTDRSDKNSASDKRLIRMRTRWYKMKSSFKEERQKWDSIFKFFFGSEKRGAESKGFTMISINIFDGAINRRLKSLSFFRFYMTKITLRLLELK